jgi:multidrug efflux pump subunit AcrA (membrane-fusion protein)
MKKTFLLILLGSTLVLSACNTADNPIAITSPNPDVSKNNGAVVAEGNLLPSPALELAFLQPGQIQEMLVKPGDLVREGDPLVSITGIETAQAQLAAATLEKLVAQQSLDELLRNALASDAGIYQAYLDAQDEYEDEANSWSHGNAEKATALELATEDYIKAEEKYQDARDDLQKVAYHEETNPLRKNAQESYDKETQNLKGEYQDLLELIPDNEDLLEEKHLDILTAIGNLESSRGTLELLEKGQNKENFAITQARLEQTEQAILAAQEAATMYSLNAPFDGTILSAGKYIPGKSIQAGETILYLGNTDLWVVETIDLAETDINQVVVGDKATIILDGIPNETFSAALIEIDPVGRDYLGDNTYRVTLKLDKNDSRFMWNMTATVSFQK